MPEKQIMWYGTQSGGDRPLELKAGPLSMMFEPDLGFLRYIRMGNREVLRGVYSAVRDQNWDTITPRIENLKLNSESDSFELSFDAICTGGSIDFFWRGRISGDAEGRVEFSMRGEAKSTFKRNRIGFCVLHSPAECAGQPCQVEQADGSIERGLFPLAISPTPPFLDIRAITHQVIPGVEAEVRFSGDTFEMEDQRNWTDASFKTFCTPLSIPFPVEILEGSEISQSVTITIRSGSQSTSVLGQVETQEVQLVCENADPVPLPEIGLGMCSHGQSLSERERSRLRVLHLSHLRVDLRLCEPGWAEDLVGASCEALALGLKLEIAIFLGNDAKAELEELASELKKLNPHIARWLVFTCGANSTPVELLEMARPVLYEVDPDASFASGTNVYFTELNRKRPPAELLDQICYSLNPQVHAFDNASLIETLEAQSWTVDSVREFAGGLPIAVSPVTLRPRFNPNATGPEPQPKAGELPSQVDVRQMSLFGAGWTLGSLKYLSQSGVSSITYFETIGWRGVMESEEGSTSPNLFRLIPGGAFPMYHVFADFGGFAGGRILPANSSDPLRVEGLILQKGQWIRILIANMKSETQAVRVRCPLLKGSVRIEKMDETNFEQAVSNPEAFRGHKTEREGVTELEAVAGGVSLSLNPYGYVCLKGTTEG